jgi:tetratricopeptide (TPR) repeat protein
LLFAQKARDADPQNPSVGRLLGLLEYSQGNFPRSIQLLQRALLDFPEDADLYFHLGLAQFQVKQLAESKAALTQALAMAPDSPHKAEARRVLNVID